MNLTEYENIIPNKSFKSSIDNHTSFMLQSLIEQYKDSKKGIRILSTKMGIHEKTLIRIFNNENKPSYQTILKICRVYYNEYDDKKLLELVPEYIKDYVIKLCPQSLNGTNKYNVDADKELQKNPVAAELFILASTGPLFLVEIKQRFGMYGVDLAEKMVEQGIIKKVQGSIFIQGDNQPQFTGETILSVSSTLISNHARPLDGDELDNNFIAIFAEGLSEEAYIEWLRIDQEAFSLKSKLTNDSKNLGDKRAFTFMITETIKTERGKI